MSYKLPIAQKEPDDAARELRRVYGEMKGDPQHPANDGNHPLHGDFLAAMTGLHEVKVKELTALQDDAGRTVQNTVPAVSLKVMQDAMNVRQGKDEATQSKLREDVAAEIAIVNKLFPGSDINTAEQTAIATPNMLASYRQMRLLGEGSYEALKPLMLADMKSLGLPAEQAEAMTAIFKAAGSSFGKDLINSMIKRNFTDKQNLIDNPPKGFGEAPLDLHDPVYDPFAPEPYQRI